MMSKLQIHGVGVDLPPSYPVKEIAAGLGGDLDAYSGWRCLRMGGEDDHPGKLAANALKAALDQAGIPGSELKAVIGTGLSREYLGSWSTAAEVMRILKLPASCMPMDISCGCLATLWALSMVQGWLAAQGGGYAAIVAGERLSGTVDRGDMFGQHLWAYGDGGSALVVGVDTGKPALWEVASTGFSSNSELANVLRVEYGGTRHPLPPEGATNYRRWQPVTLSEIRASYVNGYGKSFERAFAGTDARPELLVCNQMSPNFVPEIANFAGVPQENVVVTGDDSGHVGSADVGLGLSRLVDAGRTEFNVALGASTPFAFGAAILTPAPR